jgi:transcription termination/antitermination protein NusG
MRTDVNGSGSISDERDLGQTDSSDTPVEEGLETTDGSERADAPTGEVAMEVVEPDPVDPQPDPEPIEPDPEPVEPDPEPVEVEATEAEAESVEAAAEPEPAPVVDEDPFRGHGDWYVVHTYSGYENKVKANLESRIRTMQMEGKIFGVHIPMEDVMEIKSGKKQVVKKKQFPGYLLVRMVYDNDSWYVVRNTPGVTGFVSAGTGTKPTPLSKHEVDKILTVKKEEVRPQVRLGFEEGDIVRITSGPFADFNGTINEINPDQAKLKVLVNIFDRETPVELSFDQVSKV